MKLKKESKIRVLENFYSLDYVLFGKPVSKVDTCCPVFVEEYLSVKGALLSTVVEMYNLINYSPKFKNLVHAITIIIILLIVKAL